MISLVVRLVLLGGATGPDRNPYATTEPSEPLDPAATGRFTALTIMGCALLEGAALLAVVVYLINGNPIDLVAAGVPLLLMLLAFFPTEDRWRRFGGSG